MGPQQPKVAIFGSPETLTTVSAMAELYSDISSEPCTSTTEPEEPKEPESTTTLKKKQPRRRGRRSSRSGDSFAAYFPRVLKQVHDGLSLSQEAVNVMDSFVHDIFERIAEEAGRLARYTKRKTITCREIQTAVRLTLPGEIGRHAVSEANKAVLRYTRRK
ncbi:PREDICTED: late histone H2B.L4-like [Propithecus coquereli]|uniref:late histone H2B.L4-like n=1 Tax=Propithecus coquereli TaxID=379532 RepID=UPI00063F66FC|nr:PREDICTED: late histone H2B.L4-like [Propithecus coquereli]